MHTSLPQRPLDGFFSFIYSKQVWGIEIYLLHWQVNYLDYGIPSSEVSSPHNIFEKHTRSLLAMQTSPQHLSSIVTASIKVFHRFLEISRSLMRSCWDYIFCNNRPKPIFLRATQMPGELAVLQTLHSQYQIGLSGKQLLMFATYGTDTVIPKTCLRFHSYYIFSSSIPKTYFISHKFL